MGIGEIGVGVGGSRLLMVLIAVATMTVNPYAGLAILPITFVAIAIPQAIPQITTPFEGFLESRIGKHIRDRYGHYYDGVAKKGRFGPVEALLFIAWVVASLACFGLITLPDTTYMTLALTVVVISGLIMLAQKAHIKFTALEMVCFVVSVVLPVMASGVINGFTLPADWVADTWHKVGLWSVSAVSTVVMAYQD